MDKDAQIEKLRFDYEVLVRDSENCKGNADFLRSEVERLNALVSMLDEALKLALRQNQCDMILTGDECRNLESALSATAETVSAWQSKRDKEIGANAIEKLIFSKYMTNTGYIGRSVLIREVNELRAKGE